MSKPFTYKGKAYGTAASAPGADQQDGKIGASELTTINLNAAQNLVPFVTPSPDMRPLNIGSAPKPGPSGSESNLKREANAEAADGDAMKVDAPALADHTMLPNGDASKKRKLDEMQKGQGDHENVEFEQQVCFLHRSLSLSAF